MRCGYLLCCYQPLDSGGGPFTCRGSFGDLDLGSSFDHLDTISIYPAVERTIDLHADFAVVTSGSKHAWVCWVPGDCVTASLLMTLELLDQLAIIFMPNVYITLCFESENATT